jgi:hypothetical protein
MYGLEVRSARLGEVKAPDSNGVYNLKKNTAYRVVVTAAQYLKLGDDRAALSAAWTPAMADSIFLAIGEYFVDSGKNGFLRLSISASANVCEVDRV